MSQPSFPIVDPPIDRSDALNQIITSVAMEELSLSHILNAEGEKLQFILGTLSGLTGGNATVTDALDANESVRNTLDGLLTSQMLLNGKLFSALSAPAFTGPTGVTGSTGAAGPATGPTGATGALIYTQPVQNPYKWRFYLHSFPEISKTSIAHTVTASA